MLSQASLLLLALSVAALSEAAELAPGLVLEPPENLSMDVQSLEAVDGQPALVGYIEGEPAYFVAAEPLELDRSRSVHWANLERSLRKASDSGQFDLIDSGRYETRQGYPVGYRIYTYNKNGQPHTQAFHLLPAKRGGYWLYVTAVAQVDLKALSPLLKPVLRRAEVASPSR